MYGAYKEHLKKQLEDIKSSGLYKNERIIVTPQGGEIKVSDGSEVVNFCANNYLGLSSHPEMIQASKDVLDSHGFGMSSVRFICVRPFVCLFFCESVYLIVFLESRFRNKGQLATFFIIG